MSTTKVFHYKKKQTPQTEAMAYTTVVESSRKGGSLFLNCCDPIIADYKLEQIGSSDKSVSLKNLQQQIAWTCDDQLSQLGLIEK